MTNALVATPAFTMTDIERVAHAIAKGGLFGSKDPNAVLTLCLLAQAEGQHPAVVFRDYHIIQGRPAKKADAMLRDFIDAGGKVEWHTLNDTCADATFTHPSGSARIDWTLERAKKAQLTTPMWTKYPRQMLRSRVISEGVRTVYPGATSGLYEENEVRDIVAETAPTDNVIEVQFTEPRDELPQTGEPVVTGKRGENWGGLYPTKTALKKGMHVHHAELERLADEGSRDDFDAYLSSPEYQEFITTAGEHAPYYLEGDRHPDAPAEFVQTFELEKRASDRIAMRHDLPEYIERGADMVRAG